MDKEDETLTSLAELDDSERQPSKSILKDNSLPLLNSKRRVSFAPEVTLHKFDFVPYNSKRRKTIGFANEINSQEDFEKFKPNSDKDDRGIELLEDSSDSNDSDGDDGLQSMEVEHVAVRNEFGETEKSSNIPEEDETGEQTMEFTGLVQLSGVNTDTNTNQEEDMELTEAQMRRIENPGFLQDNEVSMDLTEINKPLIPQGIGENHLYNEENRRDLTVPREREEYENVSPTAQTEAFENAEREDTEYTMDLTQVQTKLTIPEEQIPLEVRDHDDYQTEDLSQPMDLTEVKPLSKVEYKDHAPGYDYKEKDLTDLEHYFNQQEDAAGSSNDQENESFQEEKKVITTTTTIPLADITNESINNSEMGKVNKQDDDFYGNLDDEYIPVTLNEFMNDIGIKFYDDLEIDVEALNRISISELRKGGESLKDYIVALPRLYLLTLYEFSCSELGKNIEQGKTVFQEYNRTIEVNNPELFRQYYFSSDEERYILNMNLQQLKDYSRFQSRKTWYDWRIQLTKNLLSELEAKHHDLLQERNILIERMVQIDHVSSQIELMHDLFTVKLQNILSLENTFAEFTESDILNLKLSLERSNTEMRQLTKELSAKNEELVSLAEKVENIKKEREEAKCELIKLQEVSNSYKKYESKEIDILKTEFKLYQYITGLIYSGQEENTLKFTYDGVVDIELKNENDPQISFEINHVALKKSNIQFPDIAHHIFNSIKPQFDSDSILHTMKLFKAAWSKLKEFDRDLYVTSLTSILRIEDLQQHEVRLSWKFVLSDSGLQILLDGKLELANFEYYPNNFSIGGRFKRNKTGEFDKKISLMEIAKETISNNLISVKALESATI